MTQKHTPTPWIAHEGANETRIRTTNYEGNQITPRAVCEVPHHGERHDDNGERMAYVHATSEDRANAAFIVRACNAHDELVDLLKDVQTLLNGLGSTLSTLKPAEAPAAFQAAVAIGEALLKARGEA